MKNYIIAPLLAAAVLLAACDDGRIEEKTVSYKEGRVVKMTGQLSGASHWTDDFSLALAGFDGSDDYAVISKGIPPTADGQFSIVLSGIGDDVTSIQLCVLDRLRRHVMTFSQIVPEATRDTIRMDVGTVDVSMLGAIQQGYLTTTCASCHDASARAVAGLRLAEGYSYASLVGRQSSRVSGAMLVEPGNAAASVLHQVLSQEQVEGISMNHYDLDVKTKDKILPLIDNWIESGAQEN